jgi:hypothetical protein
VVLVIICQVPEVRLSSVCRFCCHDLFHPIRERLLVSMDTLAQKFLTQIWIFVLSKTF